MSQCLLGFCAGSTSTYLREGRLVLGIQNWMPLENDDFVIIAETLEELK